MSWLPEDRKERCGYGRIFSTDWLYSALNRIGLTRYKVDPALPACEAHDRNTDELHQKRLQEMGMQISRERLQEAFEDQINEIEKDIGPHGGRFYKFVTRWLTRFFD